LKKQGHLPKQNFRAGKKMSEIEQEWEENRLERERIHQVEIEKQKSEFLKTQLEEIIILK
jgi:coenzyme F420-reducing hydrogenase delta subunit